MKLGTGHLSNGILQGKKMFDPTQTQPLSWRMHQGQAIPSEDVPMEPSNRQSPSFEDSLPDRLSERGYRLRARLGSGRLGAIYEAQDELSRISGNKHFVAVQLIDDKIATRPGFAAEFERGATELKSIAHPNIVRLLEYGSDSNRYYLVNELLESASLRFVLNDDSWGLVRASSNKPELVVVVESPASEARMREMFKAIDAVLRTHKDVGAYNQTI